MFYVFNGVVKAEGKYRQQQGLWKGLPVVIADKTLGDTWH
jgi:hypothetical protein